jgi:hypothetical protein
MKMRRSVAALSPRDRRALRWCAAVLLPALAYSFAVKPYAAAVAHAEQRLASERELLARELALLAQAPYVPAATREARDLTADAASRFFQGGDGYTATAALATYAQSAAEESNVAIRQAEPGEPSARPDGLVELTLGLRAEGDLEGILQLLRSLEGSDRLIRVDGLVIERTPSQAAQPESSGAEVLTVGVALHGYMIQARHP